MIAFPAILWTFLAEQDRECHEVLEEVLTLVNSQNPIMTYRMAELLLDWLVCAGQCEADGKSLLTTQVEPCYRMRLPSKNGKSTA